MKLPNRENAIIDSDKIVKYLLNISHKRGGSKARLLMEYGYSISLWNDVASDIREYHLSEDVAQRQETEYGLRYEIVAPLKTPSGRKLLVRTIWQIDIGTDVPRFITLIPA
ncbi:MAG: hypothetical protein KGZ58_09530 [Ignavibacteriales bacterium]|nr:hypothetical protein [Ignavibacteriales bacterium]